MYSSGDQVYQNVSFAQKQSNGPPLPVRGYQNNYIQNSNFNQSTAPRQVEVIYRYPVIHEIHHIERVPNYVTVESLEKPLKEKYLSLQRELVDLQIQYAYPQFSEHHQDHSKIMSLEQQEKSLLENIKRRDEIIDQLSQSLNDILPKQSAEEIDLNNECEKLKENFIALNKQYHHVQEQTQLKQAQLENMKEERQMLQQGNQEQNAKDKKMIAAFVGLVGSGIQNYYIRKRIRMKVRPPQWYDFLLNYQMNSFDDVLGRSSIIQKPAQQQQQYVQRASNNQIL